MADRAPIHEESGSTRFNPPALIVAPGDLVTAARSLRTISRELTAAAARVRNAAPATPVLGELANGERCTLEAWASDALLGVADHFHEQARQAIRWARADRRRKALSVARAK